MSPEEVAAVFEEVLEKKFLPLETLDAILEDDTSFDKNVEYVLSHPAEAFQVEYPSSHSKLYSSTKLVLNGSMSSLPIKDSPANPLAEVLDSRNKDAGSDRQGMNREEEYRFAKRMEFFRSRLIHAIRSMDFPEKEKDALLRHIRCFGRARSGVICLLCQNGGSCPGNELKKGVLHACCRAYNMCRALFVERNLHLVINFTRAYRTYGVPVMDLIQEGNAALIRAVEKYNWRKQVRLQTYAEFWIRQAVERAISANKWIVRVPNYIQQKMRRFKREGILPTDRSHISTREISEAFEMSNEVASHLLETERGHVSLDKLKNKLQDMFKNLTELERTIIKHRFGMEGAELKTLEELGRMMNVSRERIRQIQIRTLQKLQKPKHLKALQSYL
jgi:RNA polymerase sigma factor (sigma-70 family)